MRRSERKALDSGGQPGTEKPERKRERRTASGVDASDTVMAENSEECIAPLDQSQEGDKGTAGDHVARKKNKQRRRRSLMADKQEGELVVESAVESITAGMDPVVVQEAPVVAKGGDSHPKKNRMKSEIGWVSPGVKNLNGGLCPSPIRGVVQDLGSADVSNKQSSQLDSFKFQIAGKAFEDESSASRPEGACQPGGGVASGSGSTTVCNESSNGRTIKEVSSPCPHFLGVCGSEDKELEVVPVRLDGWLIRSTRKKLLVLDLNGILADVINDHRLLRNVRKPHKKVGGKSVFKRPFCDDFLHFCFERFEIGIWSSRKKYNVADVVEYLMGDTKHKLLFSWDQSRCTVTGFRTIENMHKPLVLKELKKLWNKEEPDLPWEKGDYSPSNTLLVDDSPYKALCNPPHTAIFPRPYLFSDENDNSLGPGGDIRVYLEGLAVADDVQRYVQEHPFGQNAITATNPSWKFYQQVIESAST